MISYRLPVCLSPPDDDPLVTDPEATKATTPTETQSQLPPSRHDPLDVNDYLMSGLVVSSIDKWFMGPVPQFSLEDLGVPPIRDLASSLKASREALANPKDNFVWPPVSRSISLTTSRTDPKPISSVARGGWVW